MTEQNVKDKSASIHTQAWILFILHLYYEQSVDFTAQMLMAH